MAQNTTVEKAAEPKEEKNSFWSSIFGWREMVALALASAVTAVYASFSINRRMGTNFNRTSKIEIHSGLGPEEISRINKARQIVKDGELRQLNIRSGPEPKEGYASAIGAAYRDTSKQENQYWKALGITGWVKKLISQEPHQRREVLFGAVGIFSVSLGAMLNVMRSEQLDRIIHRKRPAPEPSAQEAAVSPAFTQREHRRSENKAQHAAQASL